MRTKRQFQVHEKPLSSSGWPDYELIDSGNRQKLERFGTHTLIRFEPDAAWKPALNPEIWAQANAEYKIGQGKHGKWIWFSNKQNTWSVPIDSVTARLKIGESRHIGVFPEQIDNWRWLSDKINQQKQQLNILNLFAYTGVSSLFCANAGANVTHVDASKSAIDMAKESAALSGIGEKKIRWIQDDVLKFIKREVRRGNVYDAIIMDPPTFGRGPKGEIWKFENSIEELVQISRKLFSDHPIMFLLTSYNNRMNKEKIAGIVQNGLESMSGPIEFGALIQQEKSAGRKIFQATYVRWSHHQEG